MRKKPVIGMPYSIRLMEGYYEMLVSVTSGPQNVVGTQIRVRLTAKDLEGIAGWEPEKEWDSLQLPVRG